MANKNLMITTPRGTICTTGTNISSAKAVLEYQSNFGRRYTNHFTKAQKFIDSEVLRFCSARVPFGTDMLQKSGSIGTVIGSGEVIYIAPYAADPYYKTAKSRGYDANRGGKWFERGKAAERARILRGARKIAGGGQ